jgi:kinesin family member C1
LTRDSNTKAPAPAWDVDDRFNAMEQMYKELQQRIEGGILDQKSAQSTAELHQARSRLTLNSSSELSLALRELLASRSIYDLKTLKLISDFALLVGQLEMQTTQMTTQNQRLQFEVEDWKSKHSALTTALDDERRGHKNELDDMRREHRNHIDDMRDLHRKEIERAQRETMHEAEGYKRSAQDQMDRLIKEQREDMAEVEQRLTRELEDERQRMNRELEEERARRIREVQELTTQWTVHRQTAEADNDKKDRETQSVRAELNQTLAELEREKATAAGLKEKLAQSTTDIMTLESTNRAMKAKIDFLESDNQAQSQSFADLHKRMQEAVEAAEVANEKLRAEESLRRKLHNQVQELKGNIRVFCRVRPMLEAEPEQAAQIAYPDAGEESKEVTVQGPETKSAMGNVTTANNAFSFDRVFGPQSQNAEVFDEISQLVQSALDGYNVCIFCYGQTGSGKTFTMSAADGMIPRAVQQIYSTATSLEEKGWKYSMEGSFVEVYNENLNDLLGRADEFDKKKHEIRHDAAKCQTTITGVTTVVLDTPEKVDGLLKRAHTNRSVAATQSNERSSRSHSVFILKLIGENSITGERSEGTLNLVDLAGSERVDKSGVQGARLKETQNINRSLSCLGDVIGALGSSKEGAHIPYRNSKVSWHKCQGHRQPANP